MRTTSISWTSGVSGSWTLASNWSGDAVPSASSSVTIAAAPVEGAYAIDIDSSVDVASVTLDQAFASLVVDQGGSLDAPVALEAGTLVLSGGTYSGTISGLGGSLAVQSPSFGEYATLQATSITGAVTLDMLQSPDGFDEAGLIIQGGLDLGGKSAGTLTVVAQNDYVSTEIDLAGTETLSGGTLVLATSAEFGAEADTDITFASSFTLDLAAAVNLGCGGTNLGTILSSSFSTISGLPFTNAGLIELSGGDFNIGSVSLGSVEFINTGTIVVGDGATLTSLGITQTGSGEILVQDGGTFALVGTSLTLAELEQPVYSPGGVAALYGTLANSGTLTFTSGNGPLPFTVLADGGEISGGVIVDQGGLLVANGTLSDLSFSGNLDIGNNALTLDGTVTFTGGGTLALSEYGELALTPGSAVNGLTLQATGGEILLESAFTTQTVALSGDFIDVAAGDTLQVEASYTPLESSGTLGIGVDGMLNWDGIFINAGLISVAAGGTFASSYVTGPGSFNVQNSGTIALDGAGASATLSLANSGLVSVSAGCDLVLQGVANTGIIDIASGATLTIGDSADINTASLSQIGFAEGAVLAVDGELDIAGTLAIGAGTTYGTLSGGGLLSFGTIADHGGGLANFDGSLEDLTYEGTLQIGSGQTLSVNAVTFTGLSGSGVGAIVLGGGAGAQLVVTSWPSASAQLANVTITEIGAGASQLLDDESADTTLTLASSVRIDVTGSDFAIGSAFYNGVQIASAGQITDAVAGGTLTIGGNFSNSGVVAVSNGATLALDLGTFSNAGTVSLNGAVLQIENATLAQIDTIQAKSSALAVTGSLDLGNGTLTAGGGYSLIRIGSQGVPASSYAAAVSGGTIVDKTGAIQFGGSSVLSDLAWQGVLNVNRPYANVTLSDGFSISGASGAGAGTIVIDGFDDLVTAATLANAVVDLGSALPGATLEAGSLAANVTIRQTGSNAALDTDAAGSNAGTILTSATGGNFDFGYTSFVNTGLMRAAGGASLQAEAAQTTNDGNISVASGSQLLLDLNNYYQQNVLNQASFTNAGQLSLAGGLVAENTDNSALPEVAVLNTGRIAGAGDFAAPVVNNKRIFAQGGTFSLSGSVSGKGQLGIGAGSELKLTGAVGGGQRVNFGGVAGELALAPRSFLGTLSNLAAGDKIDLLATAASAASFHGDSVIVTLSVGGTFTLATSTAETGSITVASDGAGGSLLTVASVAAHASDAFVWHQ